MTMGDGYTICYFDWAPHVVGNLLSKDEDSGAQRLDLLCQTCQDTWRTYCYSGKPGKRILRFVMLHIECNPIKKE